MAQRKVNARTRHVSSSRIKVGHLTHVTMQWISERLWGADDEITRRARETGRSPTALIIERNSKVIDNQNVRSHELQQKALGERKMAVQWMQKKNKSRALSHLKRAKMYESQADKLNAATANIEQQLMTIEAADTNMCVADSMRTGAQSMRSMHKALNVDDVHETMDTVREQLEDAELIGNALGEALLGNDAYGDDDELAAELDALEQSDLDDSLSQLSTLHVTNQEPVQERKLPVKGASVKSSQSSEIDDIVAELQSL